VGEIQMRDVVGRIGVRPHSADRRGYFVDCRIGSAGADGNDIRRQPRRWSFRGAAGVGAGLARRSKMAENLSSAVIETVNCGADLLILTLPFAN